MGVEGVYKGGGSTVNEAKQFLTCIEAMPENSVWAVSAPLMENGARMTDELSLLHRYAVGGEMDKVKAGADAVCDRMDGLFSSFVGSEFRERMLNTMPAYLNTDSAMNRDFTLTRGEVFTAMYIAEAIGARYDESVIHLKKSGMVDREKTDLAIREQCAQVAGRLVVPGFVAIGYEGQITTLQRGGTDRTAVNYAEALDVPCTILKDGPILTGDPRKVDRAYVLAEVSIDEMHEAFHVGNPAVQGYPLAEKQSSDEPIIVRSAFDDAAPQTQIVRRLSSPREEDIAMVTGKSGLIKVDISDSAMAYERGYILRYLSDFNKAGLSFDHMPTGKGAATLTTEVDPENPESTSEAVDNFIETSRKRLIGKTGKITKQYVGVVSAVGENLRDDEKSQKTLMKLLQVAQSIGCVVKPVLGYNVPSIALLTDRERVDDLVREIHRQEIEKS